MDIEHISVSRYQTWQQCQMQYKYRYHLKVVPPGEEPFYFTYGKVLHKIAQMFVDSKGTRTLKDVVQDVLSGNVVIEEGRDGKPHVYCPPVIPADYKKRMPGHLNSIARLTEQIGFGGITEHKFRYDLDPPNNRFVTGFIDRFIEKDGSYFIIDYKTSKESRFRKNSLTILNDLQLRTYARVVQREFGVKAENIKCALYYLEGGNLVGAKYSQQSLEAAESELLEAYKQIAGTEPDAAWGNVGQHCDRCDYVRMCPFYRMH